MAGLETPALRRQRRAGRGSRQLFREGIEGRTLPLHDARRGARNLGAASRPGGLRGTPAERVADALAPEDWADWEPGARGVYYKAPAADRGRGFAVAYLREGAAHPIEVVKLADPGWSGLAVSPDETSLFYARVDRHACDIRVIDHPR